MKYWNGYPLLECPCGFVTPDEDDFERHIKRCKRGQTAAAAPVSDDLAVSAFKPVEQSAELEMEDKNG